MVRISTFPPFASVSNPGPLTNSALHRPDKWKTVRLRRDALKLRDRIGSGSVLTLGPVEAPEAGFDICRPLSTGPFAFRVAKFIEPQKRQGLEIIAPEDLGQSLQTEPPAAILLGYEPELESSLGQAAKEWGFREYTLGTKRRLWLPARNQPSLFIWRAFTEFDSPSQNTKANQMEKENMKKGMSTG